jgi:hypothetical protein
MGIGINFVIRTKIFSTMKKPLQFLLALFALVIHSNLLAQSNIKGPVKVAVFAPIYINEAFDGNTFKLGKNSLPKNLLPGLEFYNGVMMAIDSLDKEGIAADISIYDTKDLAEFNRVVKGGALNNTQLIIAALTNTTELSQLSTVAFQKNIPFISATYPNTGNISNPYFVLLNSSLQAHVEGIYKYLQRNHSLDNIVMFKRKGAVEDYLKNIFTELNKNTRSVSLKMKWVELTDTFYTYQATRYLDSTKRNVVVVASPYESFGLRVVKGVNTIDNFTTTVVGMPTWDGINELNKSSYNNVEIVYSTPFNYPRNNSLGANISHSYRAKYNSRPSDMVYRGYEVMYHFTKLLIKNNGNFMSKLSDNDFTLFNQFDIQPVKLKKENNKPDYYENKKLYFIKKQQGDIISVIPF